MVNFTLDTAGHSGRCELIVTGEIDVYAADDVAALGMLNLTESRVTKLIVDQSGVANGKGNAHFTTRCQCLELRR